MSDTPLVIAAAALIAIGAAVVFERSAIAIPPVPERQVFRPDASWREAASSSDVLTVQGRQVYYYAKPRGWSNPPGSYHRKVSYSSDTLKAKPFRYIIIHYTRNRPDLDQSYYAEALTRLQHEGDKSRGGSFGYHAYITSGGDILQAAPLSVRTNHIMPRGSRPRRGGMLADADNDNSIGISAVGAWGACPNQPITSDCVRWIATDRQEQAIIDAVHEVQARYGIPCRNVAGHGEVQPGSRNAVEGSELAGKIRGECG